MKNSNLFIKLTCIIPALLILCMVKLTAQDDLIGYTFIGGWVNQHFFYISDCEASWEEANDAATEMGGYLATISYADDWAANLNEFIGYIAYAYTNEGGAWIGYRGEQGIYQWANGEPENLPDGPFWWHNQPAHADGATLIGTKWEYNEWGVYPWISKPVSNEYKYIVEFNSPPDCNSNNPNKTYVCHNGQTICVSISSLQGHLNHGDLEGPCGPCNIPAMQILPDDGSEIDGHALHEEKLWLSVPQEELDLTNEKIEQNQIQVLPNPASAEIHVVIPGEHHEGVLRILSLTGQEIHTFQLTGQQSIVLNISAYASGLYLVDVQGASGHYQKKLVKL